MRPQLEAIAAYHGGVFKRGDAVDCGYSEREMKTLTRPGGGWVVVRRGVYADRYLWESLDEDGRYVLGVRAVSLSLTHSAVPSHSSAAAVLKLPMRPRWRNLQHVTRPGVTGGRTESGVKHHLAGFDETDLTIVDGLHVMALARTAIDIGREFGYEDCVIASDAALRRGTTHAKLQHAIARMTSWPSITPARAALAVADGGAETIGESLTRLLVLELDIGIPETQFEVRDGDRWAVADLRVGRHLFEFDGRVKYVGRERGGVADRPVEEIVWSEKLREDWVRGQDFGMSRVIWDDLFGVRRRATKQRLAREYFETLRRYAGAA